MQPQYSKPTIFDTKKPTQKPGFLKMAEKEGLKSRITKDLLNKK
jgi:hypothetical protein